jgi:hypothetical protein
VLTEEYVRHNIEGALLVGDLPVAWYRQFAFEAWEQFPMDIYLQDLDAVFYDDDSDGQFDRHSPLQLEIFTARLHADVQTLTTYFERVNEFRRSGPLLEPTALVFIDDDWSHLARYYSLDSIYQSVNLVADPDETSRERYIELLTHEGYEFVLQMMHSTSSILFFEGEGSGSLHAESIRALDLRCSFVHMWNCYVTRFPQENDLGSIFALENEHGLAVIGSTKKGAVRPIEALHGNLARSQSLGTAFQAWYNTFGHENDEWSLGILLIGDPMLTVWGDVTGMTALQLPVLEHPEETERLEQILIDTPVPRDLGTFEDYRRDHPEFFPE